MLQGIFSRAAKIPDEVVVATSTEPDDLVIEEFCKREKIPCYLGSETNVLDRYYQCALPYQPEIVVRVTADCPLLVPASIDEAVEGVRKKNLDYYYVDHTKVPLGLGAEAFLFSALERAWKEAKEDDEKEHVTLFFGRHPRKFKILCSESEAIPARPQFRLTVDEPADYELMKNIYDHLYKPGKLIDIHEVIQYLDDNPDVARINANVKQKDT